MTNNNPAECYYCSAKFHGDDHITVIDPNDYYSDLCVCSDCYNNNIIIKRTIDEKMGWVDISEYAVIGAGIVAIGVCVAKVLGLF